MSTRDEWRKTCQELEQARAALDEAERAFEKVATDRGATRKQLRATQAAVAECLARVEGLAAIELNLRHILETHRLRNRKTDA
jgi:hypothetical protein